ncbi:MAG: hypothetical protein M1294_05125 [Firmicutes bacterium]|jgi:hypothetical protein|uniref:Uncharacterized protein n=1 Tax=Sulfobacillus benefaciens TaxID=453960 RepID=A0A2T2X6Q0_9FIRM|nr:hypothetical protein [Bacillota bacterium]MCL5013861.1 hypothetical protein [Bacillota bacterium]PSR30184.1 MAG: hypothetical protein C7B43_06655 [Sulfobacillus benefaciens]HBQ94627.1 hypothetical protein [Sulfobacillus sp.]
MAVQILSVVQQGELWVITLKVYEGVYRKDAYTVRVVDTPLPPAEMDHETQENIMKTFVLGQVTKHMRRGSLPPTGMQIDGRNVWETETASTTS